MGISEILEYKFIDIEDGFHLSAFNIFALLLIFFITRLAMRVVKRFIYKQNRFGTDKGRKAALFNLVRYFVWTIAVGLMLQSLGVKLTILLGASTALLVGLGFGIQQVFNDVFSGFILLFEGSVDVEDIVEVDKVIGRVKKISLRTSQIETRDEIVIIVPNSKLTSENVINWSHNTFNTRFKIDVGVAYGSDTQLVKRLLVACAEEHQGVSKKKKPFVLFSGFGESSLDFELYFWSDEVMEIELIMSDIRFMIDQKFRKNDVEIPFPQRDLHVKSGFVNRLNEQTIQLTDHLIRTDQ